MNDTRATFVGIGAQKCASTWLYGVLQQSPDVQVSEDKEVDFFSYYFDRGYEWYERHFASDSPSIARGEISPSYFIHPDAPARAYAYNPKMTVFVTLRDPVARCFSNHLHEVRKGHASGKNTVFETALDNNPLYRDQGRYAHHLKRWYDVFPADQIHVMFQEDIHIDRAAMARQVTDALGLRPLDDFLDLRANESVRYKNAAVGETLWKFGNFARKNGMGRIVETAKAVPPIKQLRASNRQSIRDVVAPMTADTERYLTDYYARDVEKLERLIGRQTPWRRFAALADVTTA
jgi:hypothetical protein